MVLNDQGVALECDHLVSPLIARGLLVRPVEQEVVRQDTRRYFAFREDKAADYALGRFRSGFFEQSGIPANA